MITLYGFGPVWGLIDLSPFVTKVDTYLRLSGIPFRLERYPFLGIGNAPKGKLPFIDDEGQQIADSGFIVAHLKRRYGADLDVGLEPHGRALTHSLRRMVEEHLYWVLVQQRWRISEGWEQFMSEIFGDWRGDPQLATILPKVREEVLGQLQGQGMGRHSIDEVWQLGMDDISALSVLLANRPYFLGGEPTSIDATAYAFLIHLQAGIDAPIADHVRAQTNLMDYCARMEERLHKPVAQSTGVAEATGAAGSRAA